MTQERGNYSEDEESGETLADACDWGHAAQSVRLETGGSSGVYLCREHWAHEMAWRRERNRDLAASARFDVRGWPLFDERG